MSGTLADLPGCGRAFAAVRYDLDLGTSADATGGAVDRLDLAASLVIAFADEADAVGRAVLEPEKASASAKLARAIKLSRADKCNLFFATFFIFGFSSCCVLLGTPVGYLSARVFRAGTACQAFSSFFCLNLRPAKSVSGQRRSTGIFVRRRTDSLERACGAAGVPPADNSTPRTRALTRSSAEE